MLMTEKFHSTIWIQLRNILNKEMFPLPAYNLRRWCGWGNEVMTLVYSKPRRRVERAMNTSKIG